VGMQNVNKNAIDYLMEKLKPYLKVDDLNKPIIDFYVRRAKSRVNGCDCGKPYTGAKDKN
jgi:hypothetical protein